MKYLVQQKYRVKSEALYWDWGCRDFYVYTGKDDVEEERPSTMAEPSELFVNTLGFDTIEEAKECMAEIADCYNYAYPNHYLDYTEIYECDTDGVLQ